MLRCYKQGTLRVGVSEWVSECVPQRTATVLWLCAAFGVNECLRGLPQYSGCVLLLEWMSASEDYHSTVVVCCCWSEWVTQRTATVQWLCAVGMSWCQRQFENPGWPRAQPWIPTGPLILFLSTRFMNSRFLELSLEFVSQNVHLQCPILNLSAQSLTVTSEGCHSSLRYSLDHLPL
jgi:hypothetical protein